MNEPTHLQKVFQGILSTQSFELLEHFLHEESWSMLHSEEREVLAQLFLLRGESFAKEERDYEAKESFRAACALLPGSAKCWYRLGAYQSTRDYEEDLLEGFESLKKALSLDGRFFDAQFSFASCAQKLGVIRNDAEFLIQADKAFSEAFELVESSSEERLPGPLFWQWGIVWFSLGRESGEPSDFKKAIDLFKKAETRGIEQAEFYTDYADVLFEFASFMQEKRSFFDALKLYQQAIDLTKDTPNEKRNKAARFYKLGNCFQYLFTLEYEERYFEEASRAYTRAHAYCQDLSYLYAKWGILLLTQAKLMNDLALLESACMKFRQAEEKGEQSSILFASHAEALLSLSHSLESIDYIARAHDYARRSLELDPQDKCPEAKAMFALCQYEYGRYFQEDSYFESAIEVLQRALILHPKCSLLWYILALVKVAKESENTQLLKEAILCFKLASQSSCAHFPSFWNDWGMTLMVLGGEEENSDTIQDACTKFEKAIELSKKESLEWKFNLASCKALLGDLFDDEGAFEEAIDLFSTLLQEDPSCSLVLYHLALSYLHLGELYDDEELFLLSSELLNKYLTQEPEDEDAWTDYAIASINKGLHERSGSEIPPSWFSAEESLLKAISLGDERAFYSLGCLYSLMGNFMEAMASLEQAYQKDALPPFPDIQEDVWLQPIRATPQFQNLLKKVASHLDHRI